MLHISSLNGTNQLPGVLMPVRLEILKLCAEPGVVRGCPCTLERLVLDPREPAFRKILILACRPTFGNTRHSPPSSEMRPRSYPGQRSLLSHKQFWQHERIVFLRLPTRRFLRAGAPQELRDELQRPPALGCEHTILQNLRADLHWGCTEPVTHILDRSCRPRRPEASGLRVSPAPADKENTSHALQC